MQRKFRLRACVAMGLLVLACGPAALTPADVTDMAIRPMTDKPGPTCLVHPLPLHIVAMTKNGERRDSAKDEIDLKKGISYSATVGRLEPVETWTAGVEHHALSYQPPADARQLLDREVVVNASLAPGKEAKLTLEPSFEGCDATLDFSGLDGAMGMKVRNPGSYGNNGPSGPRGGDGKSGAAVEVRLSQLATKKYGDLVLVGVHGLDRSSSFMLGTRGAKITIVANGGAGGRGADGWGGWNMDKPQCSPGGNGGNGGSGGNGGRGGSVKIVYDRAYPDLANIVVVDNRGGAGGAPGVAGLGGRGCAPGVDGHDGAPGQPGSNGSPPEIIAADHVFDGDLPKSTARMEFAGGAPPSTSRAPATANASAEPGSWDALKLPGGYIVKATNATGKDICALELAKSPGNLLKSPLKKGESRELHREGTLPKIEKNKVVNLFSYTFNATPCGSTAAKPVVVSLGTKVNELTFR